MCKDDDLVIYQINADCPFLIGVQLDFVVLLLKTLDLELTPRDRLDFKEKNL